MINRGIILAALFATAAIAAPNVIVKYGVKAEGSPCTFALECASPLYCLNPDGQGYKCAKKPCSGAGQCIIGQQCATSGLCDLITCDTDSKCPGNTICSGGKCGNKGNTDQACTRDEQCWSGKCVADKCEAKGEGNIASRSIKRLSGGGIAGIVIGILLLIALCIFLSCCIKFMKKKTSSEETTN